jgi:hypothetical protein
MSSKTTKADAPSPAENQPVKGAAKAADKKSAKDTITVRVAPRNTVQLTDDETYGPGETLELGLDEAVRLIEAGVVHDLDAPEKPAPVMGSTVQVHGDKEVKIGRVDTQLS